MASRGPRFGTFKKGPYRGRLAPREIAEGINAAVSNAKRLLGDARLLLTAERFASATALSILAIEEAGKTAVLRRVSVSSKSEELRAAWDEFGSHHTKNRNWILPSLVEEGATNPQDFLEVVAANHDHTFVLERTKQLAIYVDCVGRKEWSAPSAFVSEKVAKGLVLTAEILVDRTPVSEREVALWVKHCRPCWDTPDLPAAVLAWKEAVESQGLALHPLDLADALFVAGVQKGHV